MGTEWVGGVSGEGRRYGHGVSEGFVGDGHLVFHHVPEVAGRLEDEFHPALPGAGHPAQGVVSHPVVVRHAPESAPELRPGPVESRRSVPVPLDQRVSGC